MGWLAVITVFVESGTWGWAVGGRLFRRSFLRVPLVSIAGTGYDGGAIARDSSRRTKVDRELSVPPQNLHVILIAGIVSLLCYQRAALSRYVSVIREAMQLVNSYYLEPVDQRELFENSMTGMCEGLDQYSAYIRPDPFRELETTLDQEFPGIGVELQKPDEGGPIVVHNTLVGSPAFRAGMRAGDKILAIDGFDTGPLALKDIVTRMRGAPGTSIRLRLLRAGRDQPEEMTLKREVVLLDSVLGDERRSDGSWDFHLSSDPRIGYLRVSTFGKHTAAEMRKSLTAASGKPYPYKALIVDLRGNAGGLLDAAVEVCDLFLDKGVIVSISDRNGHVLNRYSAKPGDSVVPANVPIVVLVDTLSASASEIVAACLQDHRRAVIAGSRTWGKGTVQNVYELESGRSALKLTTAKYLRPSGKNIHRFSDATDEDVWGVLPDAGLTVKLSDEQTAKLVEQRLKRDNAALAPSQVTKREPTSVSAPEAAKGELGADPQLRRAVEFLQKKLGRTS